MNETQTIFGMSPIFIGWIGSILVLGLIDWLSGK